VNAERAVSGRHNDVQALAVEGLVKDAPAHSP
jgi:hypothetical protein